MHLCQLSLNFDLSTVQHTWHMPCRLMSIATVLLVQTALDVTIAQQKDLDRRLQCRASGQVPGVIRMLLFLKVILQSCRIADQALQQNASCACMQCIVAAKLAAMVIWASSVCSLLRPAVTAMICMQMIEKDVPEMFSQWSC